MNKMWEGIVIYSGFFKLGATYERRYYYEIHGKRGEELFIHSRAAEMAALKAAGKEHLLRYC